MTGRPWGKLVWVAVGSFTLIGVMTLSDTHHWIVPAMFVLQIAAVLFFALRKNDESRRIAAILVFFMAAQIFWAIFEQAGSSISLFAERLTNNRIPVLNWD